MDHPHARTLEVLLSPLLQTEVEGFAAGYSILPPGSSSDLANHPEGEMFCIVAGRGEVKGEKQSYRAEEGTMAWCPPGEYHQLINRGEDILKVLWVLIPPGREAGIIEKAAEEGQPG